MKKDKNETSLSRLARLMDEGRSRMMCYAYYRLGNEADAEDAVQDVFLKVSRRLTEDGNDGVKDWKCYLFRALSNLCTTRLKHSQKVHTVSIDGSMDVPDAGTEEFQEEEFRRIDRLMVTLPEEQAEVIRLRVYGNNSFADIADILSTPLPTIKSRFLYGLTKLRRAIKDENQKQI